MNVRVALHTRYLTLAKVGNKDTQTVVSALIKQAKTIPNTLYRSLTWDRGKELADHRRFTLATNVDGLLLRSAKPVAAWLQ
jgi:IS30 family transposase